MLSLSKHEWKILNNFSARPIRPEPFDKPVPSLSKGEQRYMEAQRLVKGEQRYMEAQRLVEDVRTFFQPLRK
jgi:hypothetical protein